MDQGPRGVPQLGRWLSLVRHVANEPRNIEQGMSNGEGPCRKMATRSRENARKTTKPGVGWGPASREMQATASRGCWWLFVTFRGNRSPLPVRNSTFLVRCSSVLPRNVAHNPTCVKQRGHGPTATFMGLVRGPKRPSPTTTNTPAWASPPATPRLGCRDMAVVLCNADSELPPGPLESFVCERLSCQLSDG